MKKTMILAALVAGLAATQAQERLPREDALKFAFYASADLKQMLNTPIATDPDVKRPVVVRDGEYGAMLLPESKLRTSTLNNANDRARSIGQLWLHKLAPLNDGQVVKGDRLQQFTGDSPEGQLTVTLCALGVVKDADGKLQLLVYGKEKEPVLRAPLKETSAKQDLPLELQAERKDDGGLLTIKILGKYEATFMVTDPELY
jgi:hypothetical protein